MREVSSCNKNDIIVGDLNSKVGNNNSNREEVMGNRGVGVMNDNGERLCDFCSVNGLAVIRTLFPHKEIHKLMWRLPDAVNGHMRTSILDMRVLRGAHIYSDHYQNQHKTKPGEG